MTLQEINEAVFKGKISLTAMINMQNGNLLPLLEEVHVEDTKTIRMRIREWRMTFVGRFIYKYPRYYGKIAEIADVFGKTPEWSDFTKDNVDSLVEVMEGVAKSSARTYLAMIKSILNDAKDEVELPYLRYADRMSVKATPSVGVYLNLKDLAKLESYRPENEKEQIVLAQFLCSCYTGARHSDVLQMSVDNIVGNYLTYVSQKTKTQTTVEAKPALRTLLPIAQLHTYVDSVFNKTIREICRKSGIDDKMKIYRKGNYETGYKWEFVASHTARRSFATNLAELNVPLVQIAKRMGHSDIKMTLRYIVGTISKLEDKANAFFM